jgi:hypothetical protein
MGENLDAFQPNKSIGVKFLFYTKIHLVFKTKEFLLTEKICQIEEFKRKISSY